VRDALATVPERLRVTEGAQLDPNDAEALKLIAAGADTVLGSGAISLQAEGHPLDFKSVELRSVE
jgi:hypothetical protein